MTHQEQTMEEIKLLQTLESFAQGLQRQDPSQEQWQRLMEMLADALGGSAAALFRHCYRQDNSYHLECLASNQPPCINNSVPAFPVAIESSNSRFWKQITVQEIKYYKKLDDLHNTVWRNVFVSPINCQTGPFGFLSIIDCARNLIDSSRVILSVVSNMLSLWVDRCNIKKQFDDVFTSFPNPSFIMTTDERIAYWNQANEELTGWLSDDIIGQDDYTSSLPYYAIRRPMVANLIMRPDPKWQATYFEFDQDNDRVNALAFCSALPGGGGYLRTNTLRLYDVNDRLWGAIHAVRDVTMERKMRENLERSESLYRVIADFAGVGILLFSGETFIYANERIDDFFGKCEEIISFDDLCSRLKFKNQESLEGIINQVLHEKVGPLRFEFQTEQEGDIRYFNALAQLISYSGQDVVHFVIDDVSKQKELDNHARSNELKLFHEERLTSLGTMAAGIAHELNQPLNTIRVITDGFLFCEEKGWRMDRDELNENVEMISKQVVRMSSVIQTIRNFSREDMSQEFVDVYLNHAVENVFSMIGRQLEAHNIRVQKELANNLPPIKAAENRLEQVVTNLLINARQAFDTVSRDDFAIKVATGFKDENVFLEISDNATGIPENLLKKIFYPVFTTKQVGKGTGLGLSICQSIVSSMNGKLDVFNNTLGGATFIVHIPYR